MKTLPTLAAVAIAIVLLASPMVTNAAGTITVSISGTGSFQDSQSYTISGTLPSGDTSPTVGIVVKNPSSQTVDQYTASVSSGAFSYPTAVGGTALWVTGTYTVTATDSAGSTGTATFTYTATPPFNMTQWILNIARNQTIIENQIKNIQGNLTLLQASEGVEQKDMKGNFSALSSAITTLSGAVSTLSGSVASIQNTLTQMGNTLSSINTAAGNAATAAGNAATQAQNAASVVSNTQTYVLVVAVLAAITLVLELAILVRKLS